MAWPITFDKFLWLVDLKYGVYINGGLHALACLGYLFHDSMDWYDYMWWVFGVIPMTTIFVMLMIDMTNKTYIRATWYFAFLSFCVGGLYVIISTIYIAIMISTLNSWGETQLEDVEATSETSELLLRFSNSRAGNAYRSMPDAINRLFHDGADADTYVAEEDPFYSERVALILWLVLIWVVFVIQGYMTNICYDYYLRNKVAVAV